MNMLGSIPLKNSVFIIYLLEDEQELNLGMLICLQRIYNILLFHVVILSILDVLPSFTSNFISFFGTHLFDIVPSASCHFLLVSYFTEYPYQTESKCNEIFWRFFSSQKTTWEPRKCRRGGPQGPQGTRARQRPLARPSG